MTLVSGNFSDTARVWLALAPMIAISAYFIGGMLVYAVLRRVGDVPEDAEMLARGETVILSQYLRQNFIWVIQPLWRLVIWSGLPVDAITTLSVLVSFASGIAMAGGRFALGGWLYIFSGILDVIDGRLARHRGTQSDRGAALDSVLDRYSDAAVLVGLAWYYADSWVLAVVLLALVGSLLTSYVRARGEGLGVSIKTGVMQRAERIVVLGVATAFAPVFAVFFEQPSAHPMHWLAVAGLMTLALSSQWTAAQRLRLLLERLDIKQRVAVLSTDRDGIFRSLVVSGVATGVDFLVVILLVERGAVGPWQATAVGCAVGAVVSFSAARIWAFSPSNQGLAPQAGRYAFVSLSSLGLNAGGVAVWQLLPIDFRLAWLMTRGLVFLFWNFPLHRDFVFADPTTAPHQPSFKPMSSRHRNDDAVARHAQLNSH